MGVGLKFSMHYNDDVMVRVAMFSILCDCVATCYCGPQQKRSQPTLLSNSSVPAAGRLVSMVITHCSCHESCMKSFCTLTSQMTTANIAHNVQLYI